MSLMRTYRAALTLSQSAFAARLNVPLETYRTWDSGRREPSKELLSRVPSPVFWRRVEELESR